jgi:hypothetical protein
MTTYIKDSIVLTKKVRVAQSLVFCVMFGRSLLVLLAIVLSVLLPFSTSDYPFGIFNFSCIDMMKKADN